MGIVYEGTHYISSFLHMFELSIYNWLDMQAFLRLFSFLFSLYMALLWLIWLIKLHFVSFLMMYYTTSYFIVFCCTLILMLLLLCFFQRQIQRSSTVDSETKCFMQEWVLNTVEHLVVESTQSSRLWAHVAHLC